MHCISNGAASRILLAQAVAVYGMPHDHCLCRVVHSHTSFPRTHLGCGVPPQASPRFSLAWAHFWATTGLQRRPTSGALILLYLVLPPGLGTVYCGRFSGTQLGDRDGMCSGRRLFGLRRNGNELHSFDK